jgi:hypothetical protein
LLFGKPMFLLTETYTGPVDGPVYV